MSREMNLPPDLREFESRLAGLRPAEPRIDRDALMFGAGHASAMQRHKLALRLWQSAFITSLLCFAGLAILQRPAGIQHAPETTMRQAQETAPSSQPDLFAQVAGSFSNDSQLGGYLLQRQEVLQTGRLLGQPIPAGSADSMFIPTLKRAEGLDALPAWQRRAVLPHIGGNQS